MRLRSAFSLGLVAGTLFGGGAVEAQVPGLAWSGSVKSLVLQSRSATGQRFELALNRLRIEGKGELAPGLALDLQYDNELLVGSFLQTAEFRAAKDITAPQYWHADANYLERGDVYGRHRLHRATLTLTAGRVDLKAGRQRIAWGTGRFWSPLDILNPIGALALEREERLGVDALLMEVKFGPLSRLGVVVAPAPGGGPTSRAALWHGNANGVDYSIVAGRVRGLDVVGADLASQIGQAGVRAEVAHLRDPRGGGYTRAMSGVDYAFSNGLTVSAEAYYNGAGVRDPARYDSSGVRTGQVVSLATRYAGIYVSYEITPLLKAVLYGVRNLDDRSRGGDVRLVWSWRPNVEFTLGTQRFGGAGRTEYGRMPATSFVQGQWFF